MDQCCVMPKRDKVRTLIVVTRDWVQTDNSEYFKKIFREYKDSESEQCSSDSGILCFSVDRQELAIMTQTEEIGNTYLWDVI